MTWHEHYYCAACAVFGRGRACWMCGRIEVERDTTRVDEHLEWSDENGTGHHYSGGGSGQPLLTPTG